MPTSLIFQRPHLFVAGIFFCLSFNVFVRADEDPPQSPAQPGAGKIVEVVYPPSQDKTPGPDNLVFGVTYRLWIPDGVKRLRGVIVHQHGCGKGACEGGFTAAEDLHWQALARKWDCALLGPSYQQNDGDNCRYWCDPRNGSRSKFLQALKDLGKSSGHPELISIPWCLWGHSGGGFWASLMQCSDPDRIVAIWMRSGTAFTAWEKGEIPKPEIPDEAYAVPVMCNPGIKEKGDARFNGAWTGATAMHAAYRAQGAKIGIAPDPNSSHDCGDSRYLAIPYFDACLAMRLPDPNTFGTTRFPKLKPVNDADAWLAEPLTDKAQPAADYAAPVKTSVWLPNARVAKIWSEYVRNGIVADDTPPPAPTSLHAQRNVNPQNHNEVTLTWVAAADLESGVRGFIILRDGQELAVIPPVAPGKPALPRARFQGLSYHDTPNKPVPPTLYRDRTAKPNQTHHYQVITVNGAGLSSNPSAKAAIQPAMP